MKFTFATVLLFVATAFCVGPNATVNLHEAEPNRAFGQTHRGIVKNGPDGEYITCLFSLTVPNTGKRCGLKFSNWDIATGSKTIALFSFVPNDGAETFDVEKATFNSKTGHRDQHRSTFVVGDPGPIYKFKCPPAGSIVNYEAVPSNGEMDVEWDWRYGGFILTAHN